MFKRYLTSLFILALILFFAPRTVQAQNAVLYFSPAKGSFSQGESFWSKIMIDTKGELVNAVAAYLSYPEDKLESLGVDTSGSIMTIWAEKNAGGGKIEIASGLPTPGFSGVKKIASIGFKVKVSSGSINLKFNEDSIVLRDSDNKNILDLAKSGTGNYSFLPPATASPPPPSVSPEISEVNIAEIARDKATISWKTDIDSDSTVEYGLTTDYGLLVTNEKHTKDHLLVISELSPGTLYHFKVKSKEASGTGSGSEDFTFSTLGYQGEIEVLNIDNDQPLVGAEVTFPGPPKITEVTDQEGKAVFDDLPLGKQWISVRYGDISLSYLIDIFPKEESQIFGVKFEPEKSKIEMWPVFVTIFLFVTAIILIIILLWIMKKRNIQIDSSSQFKGFAINKLLILGIVMVLIIVAIIINFSLPFRRQASQTRNSQRWKDVELILDAVDENIKKNDGTFVCSAGPIPTIPTGMSVGIGHYDICSCLVPSFLFYLRFDPSVKGAYYTSCTDYDSGYQIYRDSITGRITVFAPSAELGEAISVTH